MTTTVDTVFSSACMCCSSSAASILLTSCDARSSMTISAARTAAWPTRRRCRPSAVRQGVRRTWASYVAATSLVD